MAYIVMAYVVLAYVVTAYGVTAYIVMAYVVMAYAVMAYVVTAHGVMACIVMAYIVMACIQVGYGDITPMSDFERGYRITAIHFFLFFRRTPTATAEGAGSSRRGGIGKKGPDRRRPLARSPVRRAPEGATKKKRYCIIAMLVGGAFYGYIIATINNIVTNMDANSRVYGP